HPSAADSPLNDEMLTGEVRLASAAERLESERSDLVVQRDDRFAARRHPIRLPQHLLYRRQAAAADQRGPRLGGHEVWRVRARFDRLHDGARGDARAGADDARLLSGDDLAPLEGALRFERV